MRIVVASCQAYSDCWPACFGLLKKFWPDCIHPTYLVTDFCSDRTDVPGYVQVRPYDPDWCTNLVRFVNDNSEEFMLILQEDFLLTAPVRESLIDEAVELLSNVNVGAVRLYPCPGSDEPSAGNYGLIRRDSAYRTSCQATLWKPHYVRQIAEQCRTPQEFELIGGRYAAERLPEEVYAFHRNVQPWPLEYICTAIVRGLWDPAAKQLCEQHGIPMDWSRRGFYK